MQTLHDMHVRDGRTIRDNRSLGDLFGELSRETSDLVRQEVALAKAEVTQKVSQVGKDVGWLAVGGALAYAGLLAIMAAVIAALALVLPLWLSALLVGLAAVGGGYFLVQKGLDDLKRANLTPDQTIASLKEDAEWAKEQLT